MLHFIFLICFSQAMLLFCVDCSVFALDVWIIADLLASEVNFPLWDIELIFLLDWLNYSRWYFFLCCYMLSFISFQFQHNRFFAFYRFKIWMLCSNSCWMIFFPSDVKKICRKQGGSSFRNYYWFEKVIFMSVLNIHSWDCCVPIKTLRYNAFEKDGNTQWNIHLLFSLIVDGFESNVLTFIIAVGKLIMECAVC